MSENTCKIDVDQSQIRWTKKIASTYSALLNNFATMSKTEKADLRKVFDNTLTQQAPMNSVTVSHDALCRAYMRLRSRR